MIDQDNIFTQPTKIKNSDNFNWSIYTRDTFLTVLLCFLIIFVSSVILYSLGAGGLYISIIVEAGKLSLMASLALLLVIFATMSFCHFRMQENQRIVVWRFSDENVVLCDQTGTAITTPWSQIKGLKFRKKGVVIRYNPRGSKWIPQRSFSNGQIEQLKGLAESKVKN